MALSPDRRQLTRIAAVLLAAGVCLLPACRRVMVPTPTLYTSGAIERYPDVAPELRTTTVDVLFVTDRAPEQRDGKLYYGYGRSPSMAFGSAIVRIGDKHTTWEQLAADSVVAKRSRAYPLTLESKTELGRFPDNPPLYTIVDGRIAIDPGYEEAKAIASEAFRAEVLRRLASLNMKRVSIYLHGFKVSFEDAVRTAAELNHLAGRGAITVLYSWPAGSPGLLRSYGRDRESSEYTVYHLKELIRLLATIPEIEQFNIFAHSRGADIAVTALRELVIETRAAGEDPVERYGIDNFVLIAPDIDFEVLVHRSGSEFILRGVGQSAMYVSKRDAALGLATSLFGSRRRAGQVTFDDLGERERALLARNPRLDIIDARDVPGGAYDHGYYASPEVVSDIMLMLDGRRPGAEHGRPLIEHAPGYWIMQAGYPEAGVR